MALVAIAIAIPAALPQSPPVGAPAAIEQRQSLENIADEVEQNQDLKGSSSYGYGFYGPYYGYPHYYRYGMKLNSNRSMESEVICSIKWLNCFVFNFRLSVSLWILSISFTLGLLPSILWLLVVNIFFRSLLPEPITRTRKEFTWCFLRTIFILTNIPK